MSSVQNYYDRNTRGFLAFGRGSRTGAIHRALWRPETRNVHEAMHTIHDLIAAEFVTAGIASLRVSHDGAGGSDPTDGEEAPAVRLLDLGCGVGASMHAVEERITVSVTGITLSPVQAEIARTASPGRHVVVGDFTRVETLNDATAHTEIDGAWMIESFVHAPVAETLLRELASRLRPGGMIAICDDFPAYDSLNTLSKRERIWVDEFRAGWHVGTWMTASELDALAREAGLEPAGGQDLSDWVAVDRPRDYIVRCVAGPARVLGLHSPWWSNIRGGNALQQLAKRRLIRYQLRLFVRPPIQ